MTGSGDIGGSTRRAPGIGRKAWTHRAGSRTGSRAGPVHCSTGSGRGVAPPGRSRVAEFLTLSFVTARGGEGIPAVRRRCAPARCRVSHRVAEKRDKRSGGDDCSVIPAAWRRSWADFASGSSPTRFPTVPGALANLHSKQLILLRNPGPSPPLAIWPGCCESSHVKGARHDRRHRLRRRRPRRHRLPEPHPVVPRIAT